MIATLLLASAVFGQAPAKFKARPPEFTGVTEWHNSKPLTLKDLRGKVVIVHYWAYG